MGIHVSESFQASFQVSQWSYNVPSWIIITYRVVHSVRTHESMTTFTAPMHPNQPPIEAEATWQARWSMKYETSFQGRFIFYSTALAQPIEKHVSKTSQNTFLTTSNMCGGDLWQVLWRVLQSMLRHFKAVLECRTVNVDCEAGHTARFIRCTFRRITHSLVVQHAVTCPTFPRKYCHWRQSLNSMINKLRTAAKRQTLVSYKALADAGDSWTYDLHHHLLQCVISIVCLPWCSRTFSCITG